MGYGWWTVGGAFSFWPIMWATPSSPLYFDKRFTVENFSFLGWHVIGITRVPPPLAQSQRFEKSGENTQIHQKYWMGGATRTLLDEP